MKKDGPELNNAGKHHGSNGLKPGRREKIGFTSGRKKEDSQSINRLGQRH